jgi:hypothetical protein
VIGRLRKRHQKEKLGRRRERNYLDRELQNEPNVRRETGKE